MGFFNQPDRQFDKDTGLLKGWERVEIKDGVRYLPKGGAFGSDQELNEEEYQELVKKKTSKVKITDIPQSDDDPKGTRLVKQTTGAFHNLAYENPELTGLLAGTAKFMAGIGTDLKQSATNPNEKDLGKRLLGTFLITEDKIIEQSAKGAQMWATGGDIYNPWTKEQIGSLPDLDIDPTLAGVVGGGAAAIATGVGVDKGLNQLTKLKNLTPPPGGNLSYATVGVENNHLFRNAVQPTLDEIAARPLQAGHKMQRSTRTDNLEGLVKGNVSTKRIRDFLQEGSGGAIKPKFTKAEGGFTADKLAANPELLETLFTRNKNIKRLQEDYLKKLSISRADPGSKRKIAASSNAQRAWYDEVSKNFFSDEMLIYGKDKPRQIVAQATKWVTRDQWHHIFGNKEIGEFLMSQVAQDPLVATNLMAHMRRLKLSSSGIADNIAIMKAAGHNNLHKWLKEMGFESVAGKQAPLAIDQYATEISKYITEGVQTTTVSGKPKFYPPNPDAVNDLFEMLTYYSKANKFIRQKLKAGKITMEDGTVLSLASGKINKLPEVMSELKSKKISGVGDVLRSGELMKNIKIGTRRKTK